MIKLLIIVALAVACGALGRMGGSGRFPRVCRIVGVPALNMLLLFVFGFKVWLALLVCFGLMCSAISTYWDWLYGRDEFFTHGFFIGLSTLPITIVTGAWVVLLIRVILLTLFIGIWSYVMKNPVWEESGRYASIPVILGLTC